MSIGIAMLARNSAHEMGFAIDPFIGQVDEFAILLGGISTDKTPALTREFAKHYPAKVADYTGPLFPDGGLLDFGLARQQSFDLLTTDWALVVDTDDIWSGVDKLGEVVADANESGYQGVIFPYDLGGGVRFLQTRLFKRDAGHWSSPVHEEFIYHDPDRKTLTVNAMVVRQEKTGDTKSLEGKKASVWRNIRIAERHIEQHGFNYRMLMHLPHEYIITGQYDKSIEAVGQILDRRIELKDELTADKVFQLYYTLAMAHLCLERYELAAGAMMTGLSHEPRYGQGWTMLAEISVQMGVYDLAICAADRALERGKPVDAIPIPYANISSVPYYIKAKALKGLGREFEALTAVTLGLSLRNDKEMLNFKHQLCEELGVIP